MLADTIVAATLELEGLSFGADPDRACSLLFPHDARAVARDNLAGDPKAKPQPRKPHSICGHVGWSSLRRGGASGKLRALGGRDFLAEPYARHGGLAITRIVQLAQEQGLWHSSLAQSDIEASDLVVIGATGAFRAAFGGDEHVLVVTGIDGAEVESIDGGQPDVKNGGHPTAVLRRRRVLEQRGRELWLRPSDGLGGATRRLQGWFKAGRALNREELFQLEGIQIDFAPLESRRKRCRCQRPCCGNAFTGLGFDRHGDLRRLRGRDLSTEDDRNHRARTHGALTCEDNRGFYGNRVRGRRTGALVCLTDGASDGCRNVKDGNLLGATSHQGEREKQRG